MIRELKNAYQIKKLNFINPINLHEEMELVKVGGLNYGRYEWRRKFSIPRKPGIYIFFDSNMNVMYVGKSINLYNRFGNHMGNSWDSKVSVAFRKNKENIKFYSYAICDNDEDASIYEMLYTKIYRPKLINWTIDEISKKAQVM